MSTYFRASSQAALPNNITAPTGAQTPSAPAQPVNPISPSPQSDQPAEGWFHSLKNKISGKEQLKSDLSKRQVQSAPLQTSKTLPESADGQFLRPPDVFAKSFPVDSTVLTRALWGKKPPKITLAPDQIRVSQAALRQAKINQDIAATPWNYQDFFNPFPTH